MSDHREAELPRPGLVSAWLRFWFSPADPVSLHIVRLGAGFLFFAWLLAFLGHQHEFFGFQGWLDRKGYREAARQTEPLPEPITWSLLYVWGSDPTLVDVLYYGALVVTALFALGVATRITGVLTYILVCSFVSNPAISYDADHLLILLAFYLMVGYLLLGLWNGKRTFLGLLLGSCDNLAWNLWPRTPAEGGQRRESVAANLVLRLLQVHFAIVVFVSALHKLQMGAWWGGVAFWYPLHPPLGTTLEQVKSEIPSASWSLFWLSLAQYLLLAWQLGFPLLAWNRLCRPILLGGAFLGWVGSLYLYHLPLFGPVFFVACLGYVSPDEWHWSGAHLLGLGRLARSSYKEAVAAELGGQRP